MCSQRTRCLQERFAHWCRRVMFARKLSRSESTCRVPPRPAGPSDNWVSVAVPIRARETSLVAPRDALVLRHNGSFVFRINTENKAERIEVEIGDSSGELVSVSGALAEGDRVAIRGAENLREGADVKIIVSKPQAATTEG